MAKRYLSIAQLTEKLGGRSRSSTYREVEAGRLPRPVRIGHRPYFVEDDVEAFVDGLSADATPDTALAHKTA